MGGDRAPGEIVAGARRAAEELGIPVVLVGPDDGTLGDTGSLEVLAASEVIAMHDDPAQSVRTKKDSTLVHAAEAVRDGRASRNGQRRQHRGGHGERPVENGPAPRRRPSRDSGLDTCYQRAPGGSRGRRRQRRLPRRVARPVRPDGCRLYDPALWHDGSQGGSLVDRRGVLQGQPTHQGGARPVWLLGSGSTSWATSRVGTCSTAT